MGKTLDIAVHHITRVEGHGNLRIRICDGKIEELTWEVPEAPRFFEAMVVGRSYEDIQTVVSRICGICSATHSLAAIKAIEDAWGVPVSETTRKLRMLLHCGEHLESHVLHLGYLVAPDLFGVSSVIPLAQSHPETVRAVFRVHRLGNTIMEVVGGRMTHPVTLCPGGFRAWPSEGALRDLARQIDEAEADLDRLAEFLLGAADRLPSFSRPTEYVALVQPGAYAFYEGEIGTTDGPETVPAREFESVANEYVVPHSTAKWARWHRESYMVGALARFNRNGEFLSPNAKAVAARFGLARGCANPFFNNVAQLVECFEVAEQARRLIGELLTEGVRQEKAIVRPRAGEGVGAIEAPRGVLFHRYRFDEQGLCVGANLCIPTNQNHANIQKDLEAWVPQLLDRPADEIRAQLEMLVRAYDPCISCSTHCLRVEFV